MKNKIPTVQELIEKLLTFPLDAKVNWPVVHYGASNDAWEENATLDQIVYDKVDNMVYSEPD